MYSIILISACMLGFVSCDDSDENAVVSHPSYRDRVYSGDNLFVYIGEKRIDGVSADVKSEQKDDGNPSVSEDEDGNVIISANPSYDMTIVLSGFPSVSKKTSVTTIMYNHRDFSGTIKLDEASYEYVGEFTGTPFDPPEMQGCIIHFTKI